MCSTQRCQLCVRVACNSLLKAEGDILEVPHASRARWSARSPTTNQRVLRRTSPGGLGQRIITCVDGHSLHRQSQASLTAPQARRWASGCVAQMHLDLGADDLWRRKQTDAVSQQLEDSLISCSHLQPAPWYLTFLFARLLLLFVNFGHHKQVLRPHRSSAYLDPHLPGAVFLAQTLHGPRSRISSRLPFHKPAIAHALDLVCTRAIKILYVRLIDLSF